MKEKIHKILKNIFSETQKRSIDSYSLQGGETGFCLFEKCYIEYFKDDKAFDNFQANISSLAENSIEVTYPTLCSGKAGINWFFSYLNKDNLLSIDDLKILCEDDLYLADRALDLLSHKKYDFLHGGIGIAYYLLHSRGKEFEQFFQVFFGVLDKNMIYDGDEAYINDFDITNNASIDNQVNFGLAHGMPSVLKFCIQCYKQKICTSIARIMALKIISFLRNHANSENELCCYPSIIAIDRDSRGYSRLAWCYGDLGIGMILYQAGVAFGDDDLKNHATEVLLHSTKRKRIEETQVNDAGLCHGSAGIAHIYNKMWHYSKNPLFKEARDFWINETINQAKFKDGLSGYKSYEGASKSYINSFNLLEGTCGIGLALISYLTSNFSWDYCLMLND